MNRHREYFKTMKSELVVASFPKCNRDHSQARPLGAEGPAFIIHLLLRETRVPCDTQELAKVAVEPRTLAPGWDANPGDPPLTLPQERALVPAGCPPTSLLDHRLGSGLYLREARLGREGCPAPLETQGPAWACRNPRANTAWLSAQTLPHRENRKEPVTHGHSQALWTWSRRPWWAEEAPVPRYLPRGAGGTRGGR